MKKITKKHILIIATILLIVVLAMGVYIYQKEHEYRLASENIYNLSFYELVDYVDNVETYLAKSLISTTPEHGAETLTYLWREANLAQSYLSQLPLTTDGLSNTAKFLNQVSDYSYSLAHKNIYNEPLTQEELDNLKLLHDYSVELKNTLTQLAEEINNGTISWKELTNKSTVAFAQEVSNISKDSFNNLEENFHEYSGLIYDGAFSEHITKAEVKGLVGEEIEEEQATEIVKKFIDEKNINSIKSNGLSENGNIPCFSFTLELKNGDNNNVASIAVSRKGGHVVYYNYNRNIEEEKISSEEAVNLGIDFLKTREIENMEATYYLKQEGILTINYAYNQDGVTVYPDLIKVKVALDNGEILGMETTGYLNSHEQRKIENINISKEEAKKNLNTKLNIQSEKLAIIPTEYKTEILCWEFKGVVEEKEFLVYINVENGNEEDVLVIVNTPNGTLTM